MLRPERLTLKAQEAFREAGEEARRRGNPVLWPRGVDGDLFAPRAAARLDFPRPIFLTGGRVAVLVGSQRIGTISLVSATPRDRTLLMLPRLATGKYGSVRLVVLTSGKTVRIDALATSAR